MEDMSNLGEFIKQKRTEKNISTRELARRSGVSQPYISQLENNKDISPTNDMLKKLAKGLGISYIELLQKAGILEEDIADGENELLKENIRLNEENRKLREVIKNMQNLISDSFD